MRVVIKHLRILAPLLAAAAFAAGCGGSSSDSTAAGDGYGAPAKAAATTAAAKTAETPKSAGTTVEMTNTTFQPQSIDVKVGDTVTFVNKDEIAHTATAGDGSFDSKTMEAGASFTFKATKAGQIAYVCNFHPGMTGTINVS